MHCQSCFLKKCEWKTSALWWIKRPFISRLVIVLSSRHRSKTDRSPRRLASQSPGGRCTSLKGHWQCHQKPRDPGNCPYPTQSPPGPVQEDGSLPPDTVGHQVRSLHRCAIIGAHHAGRAESFPRSIDGDEVGYLKKLADVIQCGLCANCRLQNLKNFWAVASATKCSNKFESAIIEKRLKLVN